ncbi:hypothetical protein DV737_g1385, partial [Chaetothyriales sp. CBS 132003]
MPFHHFRRRAKGPKEPKNEQHGDPKVGTPSGSAVPSEPNLTIADLASPATPSVPTVPGPQQSLSTTPSTSATLSEQLWNTAYDELKVKEVKLVDAYEKILSHERNGHSNAGGHIKVGENSIEQSHANNRWLQMQALVQAALKKTETEANVKHAINRTFSGVLSLNDIINSALQTVPQAALAWAGVCFAMQILVNPTTETESNRNGIVHVILRMQWYCELSSLLLKENTVDSQRFTGIRVQLKKRVTDLYEALLLYLIMSVYSCYRN